jgi:sn-glycerol 3-phosphate transport system ATP-binding protein
MNFLQAGQLASSGSLPHAAQDDITVGIRPEHAEITPGDDSIRLEMAISVIEPLGPNQLVHGTVEGNPFIAVTPEMTLDPDQPLPLYIRHSNLHYFDNNGKRMTLTQQ